MGGICWISPTKAAAAARARASVRSDMSQVSTTLPAASHVSVAAPKTTVASYVLPSAVT